MTDIGIGTTHELSLRVSIAALVRVYVNHPENGIMMLALERKANLYEGAKGITPGVKVQPFGGAVRILDLQKIYNLIGDFNFDSERSRSEQDFRLYIRPSAWMKLKEFCIENLTKAKNPFLESDPGRELTEEFDDALDIRLTQNQYLCRAVATLIEDHPTPTENTHAKGSPTVRIYRVFEVTITDPMLRHRMLLNSENVSQQDLCELAVKDALNGGIGRGNAVLVVPIREITNYYHSLPLLDRNESRKFKEYLFESTVPAILEDITVPKYTIRTRS